MEHGRLTRAGSYSVNQSFVILASANDNRQSRKWAEHRKRTLALTLRGNAFTYEDLEGFSQQYEHAFPDRPRPNPHGPSDV